MTRLRFVPFLALLACLAVPAQAVEVDSGAVYCFSGAEFEEPDQPLSGVCITGIPDAATGTVMLGARVLRPGDILTSQQLSQMTFSPVPTQQDQAAVVTYLPIYDHLVAPEATMTISIRGKEDQAPVAEDSAMETYKNLPNEAVLKVTDPEGQAMTFTLVRSPKRGEVTIREDGSFLYTPKKNKVGTDSFTFTATDPAGNVSREATVTVTILKPLDSKQYTDTTDSSCSFTAEWLRNTGIFTGETINDQLCFQPEQTVTRGEFLSMVMEVLDQPLQEELTSTGFVDEAPQWLKPYLAAAMRSGLVSGYPTAQGVEFRANQPITQQEAAVMLQNALQLPTPVGSMEDRSVSTWAATSVAALRGSGMVLDTPDAVLTRAQASELLYAAHCMR